MQTLVFSVTIEIDEDVEPDMERDDVLSEVEDVLIENLGFEFVTISVE